MTPLGTHLFSTTLDLNKQVMGGRGIRVCRWISLQLPFAANGHGMETVILVGKFWCEQGDVTINLVRLAVAVNRGLVEQTGVLVRPALSFESPRLSEARPTSSQMQWGMSSGEIGPISPELLLHSLCLHAVPF